MLFGRQGWLLLLAICIGETCHHHSSNAFVQPRPMRSSWLHHHHHKASKHHYNNNNGGRGRQLYAQSDTESVLWLRDFSNTFDGMSCMNLLSSCVCVGAHVSYLLGVHRSAAALYVCSCLYLSSLSHDSLFLHTYIPLQDNDISSRISH